MRFVLIALLTTGPMGTCLMDPPPRACTQLYAYGVTINLVSPGGQAVTGATLTLSEGTYTETMQEVMPGSYVGAGERPGRYSVQVQAPGYLPATLTDLVAGSDECHVIGVARTVVLAPAS